MKVLNLDSLAKPKKTVTLFGTQYIVKEMTVADFIEVAQAAADYEQGDEDAPITPKVLLDRFQNSLNAVKRALPDVPDEVLRRMTVEQMGVLNRFLRDEFADEEGELVSEEKQEGKQ